MTDSEDRPPDPTPLAPARSPAWNRLRLRFRKILALNAVGVVLLIGAIFLTAASGILGIGRRGGVDGSGKDLAYFYGSGRCWLQGLDAYDPDTLWRHAGVFLNGEYFFYPPQIAPLAVLLGLFSFAVAKIVMIAINSLCAVGLCWICVRTVLRESGSPSPEPSPQARWIIPAIILGSPFMAHVLYMGQSSIVAAVALTGGWVLISAGRWVVGGALLGLSTLKPQMGLFPIVWLILEVRWKPLAVGGATALLAATPAIRVSGLIGAYREWIGTLSRVPSNADSAPGSPHLFSIHNVFAAGGITLPSLISVGLIATVLLWLLRPRLLASDVLPLLLGLTMLFSFCSDYDLVVLAILVPAFWRHLRGRDEAAVGAFLLLVLLFIPQRILMPTGSVLLIHFRVFVVLLLWVWLLRLSLRARSAVPTSAPLT